MHIRYMLKRNVLFSNVTSMDLILMENGDRKKRFGKNICIKNLKYPHLQ